jgi:beta-lactamase regulating signal transducer with metallopeptidase domain
VSVAFLGIPWLRDAIDPVLPRAPFSFELRGTVEPATPSTPPHGLSVPPLAIVGAAWMLAVALGAGRASMSALALRRLRARASPAPEEAREMLDRRARAMTIEPPALLVSGESSIPFTMGIAAPAIVMPVELLGALDGRGLGLVLAHELEHVRRGDARTSAILTLLRTALAYHPVAERLVREATLAREIAVDARVAPEGPREYATLLVEIAAHAHFGEKPAPVAIDDTALARRIAVITETVSPEPVSSVRLWVAALAAGGIAVAAPRAHGQPTPVTAADSTANPPFGGSLGLGLGQPKVGDGAPEPPVLAEHGAEIRTCYSEELSRQPDLRVDETLILTVTPDGRVEGASITLPDAPRLRECLLQAASSWRLPPAPPQLPGMPPPPRGGTLPVRLRLSPPAGN